MPNDLSVKAIAASTGASENPADPQAESFTLPAYTPPAHAPPARSASPIPNPQLRLDPALGLVVIEFRDNSGSVTTSIPSQRQLEAYRMWEQSRTGTAAAPQAAPPATDKHAPQAAAVHPSATNKA